MLPVTIQPRCRVMAKSKAAAALEGVNKMGLVREALQAMGGDPKPKEVQAHIKQSHNLELPTPMISSYKSMIRGGGSGRRGGRKAGLTVEDIDQVKGMINKFGADQLTKLIEALSK